MGLAIELSQSLYNDILYTHFNSFNVIACPKLSILQFEELGRVGQNWVSVGQSWVELGKCWVELGRAK